MAKGIYKMIVLDIDNIHLPSVNAKYTINPRTGKLILAPSYRQIADTFSEVMKHYGSKAKITSPYSVKIEVGTYLDADNFVKPVFDSLQKVGIIDNDRNILHYEVHKAPRKRGEANSIKVEVETWKS